MSQEPDDPHTLMALLRHDLEHVNELALLWALPRVGPGVARWHAEGAGKEPAGHGQRWEKRTIRSATGNARWGGAIMGSSFYVGMPAALAMIYCEQLGAILRVAAIHGRNPRAPGRAAEILVIQGRYPTVDLATTALRKATMQSERGPTLTRSERLGQLLHAIPSMIGLKMRRMKNPLDILIGAVEVASLFVPVVSIPAWAYANGRATSRLGQAAVSFYAEPPGTAQEPKPEPPLLLGPPTVQGRRHFVLTVVAIGLALAALAAIIPLGRYAHALPLAGRLLAEVGLVVAFSKIILATRPFGHLAADPAAPPDPRLPVDDP